MKAPHEIIHEVYDGEKLLGYIHVWRDGQQEVSKSDDVIACVRLHLLANEYDQLPEEIRFGARLNLFGGWMQSWWGDEGNFRGKKTKSKKYRATGKTWSGVMNEADMYALNETQKLLDALAARRQALIDAEKIEPAGKKKRSK